MNEIISEQKSHILRPIVMMFYAMLCTFTMSIVEVIVHDKVPGKKNYPIVHFEDPSSFIECPSSFF